MWSKAARREIPRSARAGASRSAPRDAPRLTAAADRRLRARGWRGQRPCLPSPGIAPASQSVVLSGDLDDADGVEFGLPHVGHPELDDGTVAEPVERFEPS